MCLAGEKWKPRFVQALEGTERTMEVGVLADTEGEMGILGKDQSFLLGRRGE